MSTTVTAPRLGLRPADEPGSPRPNRVYALAQAFVGLLVPLPLLRPVRGWFSGPKAGGGKAAVVVFALTGLWLLLLASQAAMYAFLGFPPFKSPPKLNPLTWQVAFGMFLRGFIGIVQAQLFAMLVLDWLFWKSFPNVPESLRAFDRGVKRRVAFERGFFRFIGTLFTLGLSVLPLTSLLVALPAVAPGEAVLTDTVRPAKTRAGRFFRRAFAVVAGLVVLVALFAFAIEAVSRLPLPERGQLAPLAKKVLGSTALDIRYPDEFTEKAPKNLPEGKQWLFPKQLLDARDRLRETAEKPNQTQQARDEASAELAQKEAEIQDRAQKSTKLRIMLDPTLSKWLDVPLYTLLPPALVEHWPFVLLIVYATDLVLLLMIGRVPIAYNARYLWVRKRDTALTALAFTVVVALVVVLLAFVNGMYQLNESTGVPGNVLVLAEGSTDEIFSNLARADAENVEKVVVTEGATGRPLARPVFIARATREADGSLVPVPGTAPKEVPGVVYLASLESYLVMNQPVPVKEGEKPRRRFLQVRAMRDARVAGAVHNMELHPGGKWFTDDGVDQASGGKYVSCVLGEGAASTLGPDAGKPQLQAGDTFSLADKDWIVSGVMKSQGTTFGSEIWTSANNVVVQSSGKGNKYTTLVLRASENTDTAAKALAYYLNNVYTQAKLKAFAEPDYYKELTKTNEQFLTWIVMLAVVMAVGGVFGVMNTMFASIAARIKEVGVMRILGFKRWQILIAFMLESLAIAVAGGALGCALGAFANFFEASSTLSGGQGGGKSVALKLVVDYQTVAAGMLFTLVMGRLGGLVPALSAMRMEILDSLR